MNFGPQMVKTGPEVLPTFTILFCPRPSHALYAALTWHPTASLDETSLVYLQLRFEAPKDVKLEMLSHWAALNGNTSL